MKVVMLKTGEVKNVPDGYARNYLLPNKLAVAATDSAVATAEAKQAEYAADELKTKAAQAEALKQLQSGKYEIKAKANNTGKLFASLKSAEIAKVLNVSEESITTSPIKQLGAHDVVVHFAGQPRVTVSISVIAE